MRRLLALLLALLLAVPGLAAGEETAQPIRIGVFEPLTGARSAGGLMEYEGILVAHALMPEVLGRPIELVPMDNRSDDAGAVRAAQLLTGKERVDIVLGSWGSALAITGGPYFEAAEIPAIGTSCTNPAVTRGNGYYFRVCYVDDFQGVLLANYAKQELGAETAAILCDISNVYAIGLRRYFRDAFGAENIVAESFFTTGATDFAWQIESLMATEPDVIFMPSDYTEPALAMRTAREMGYDDIPFLGGDAWETQAMIDAGGEAVEACRFTTFFDVNADPTQMSSLFLSKYREMYGKPPDAAVTALGFDAYLAAVLAIEAAGTTEGAAVRDALAALEFDGATGPIAFDENGDAIISRAVIMTVRNGAFTYLDTVTVEE